MAAGVTCPYCQVPLNVTENAGVRPTVCPHCLSNIEDPQMAQAGEVPNLLRDIRRNGNETKWVIGVLIGLCVLGIVITTVQARTVSGLDAIGWLFWVAVLFGLLDILVFVAIASLLLRYFIAEKQTVSASRVLGLGAVMLVLGTAVVVFFFGVCSVMISR